MRKWSEVRREVIEFNGVVRELNPEQPPDFAIIPTNGRDCLWQCLDAIQTQVDDVIVIEGGPDAKMLDLHSDFTIAREPDLNISRWWNLGLTLVESRVKEWGAKAWNVAIINDDVIVPPGWMRAVTSGMRETGSAAACSGGTTVPYLIQHTQPGPVGLVTRLKGFAFVVAGEKGIRANEQLRWYFTDDHIDWMARKLGGMTMVPGFEVEHLHPNEQMGPELQATVPDDAARFVAYWGQRPW